MEAVNVKKPQRKFIWSQTLTVCFGLFGFSKSHLRSGCIGMENVMYLWKANRGSVLYTLLNVDQLTFPYLELVKFVQLNGIFSCKKQNFLSGSKPLTLDYKTIAVNIIQNCRLKCLDI